MPDYSPEDLNREIDRLWARLGSTAIEPSSVGQVMPTPPAGAQIGSELAWETVSLLKKQARERENRWEQAMAAKEESMRALLQRYEALEAEAARLRERVEGHDERELVDALELRQSLETAKRSQELTVERHAAERQALEETLQTLRERLAAEAARARQAEQRWNAREQQYLLDLKELQALAGRREKDAGKAEEAGRAREAVLAEAKNALEKTLAELLLERRERERSEQERAAAVKKVEDLRKHVDELSRIWEEERAQWRQLWDRERSTWDSQRTELAQWEENLRREREAWHAELQAKEKAHLELTESLAGKLRETTQTAERMGGMMQAFELKDSEQAAAQKQSFLAAAMQLEKRRRLQKNALKALAGAAALALLVPVGRWFTAWSWTPESTAPAPAGSPTALALDGTLLWVGDWSGRLTGVNPADPRQVVRHVAPAPGGPYRPSALAFGAGRLWTTDAAQGRLVRHDASVPEKIVAVRASPGAAPVALAFDGETVWSYDAVTRLITRHAQDDSPAVSFPLPDESAPNAMAWADGKLWAHDSRSKTIKVYRLKEGRLELRGTQALPVEGVIGMIAAGGRKDRRLFLLLAPGAERPQAAIARYRLKKRIPFTGF